MAPGAEEDPALRAAVVWESFRSELRRLDDELRDDLEGLPEQLRRVPLDVWGAVLLEPDTHLPNRGQLLPRMPSEEVQLRWTGQSGTALLRQSLAFVRCLRAGAAPALDYGVGWGRISRLVLKYVAVGDLHGVDAWQESLDHAAACRIPHPLRLVGRRLAPGELGGGYALVYAFSVFTHLSPGAFTHNLAHLVRALRPGGRLVITVLPPEFWELIEQPELVDPTFAEGVVHQPSETEDYGWTAVAPWWIEDRLREHGLVQIERDWNHCDAHQVIWSARSPGG